MDKDNPLSGQDVLGEFRLAEELGVGGLSRVWKATPLSHTDRYPPEVALKFPHKEYWDHPDVKIAYEREFSVYRLVKHPGIAEAYGFGIDEESSLPVLVLEVLKGTKLNDRLRALAEEKRLIPNPIKVLGNLAASLSHIHDVGFVHSNFKPGTIFVTEDGSTKIFNFGLARALRSEFQIDGEAIKFDPGILGALTPAYASVEMCEGERAAPSDDIYAFALIAFELFAGKHPFNKVHAVKVRDANIELPVLPNLTRWQNRVLRKALNPDLKRRTISAQRILNGLQKKGFLGWCR